MEDLLVVLGVIVWFVSYAKKKKKKKASPKAANIEWGNAAKCRADRLVQLHEELEKRRAASVEAPKAEVFQPSGEGETSFADAYSEPVQPEYTGSLQTESTEGICLCEPELEHGGEIAAAQETVYTGEIGREPLLDFSAKGIVQGFVMSEILRCPSRRTGYR